VYTLSLCSSLNVRDKVSHPYRTTGEIEIIVDIPHKTTKLLGEYKVVDPLVFRLMSLGDSLFLMSRKTSLSFGNRTPNI
jgi:hypothetical protein